MTIILLGLIIYLIFEINGLKKALRMQNSRIKKMSKKLFELIETNETTEESLQAEVVHPLVTDEQTKQKVIETETATEKPVTVEESPILTSTPKPTKTNIWDKKVFSVESIIAKLGILLLLIGTGFIFKYTYDHGFLTEEVTLLLGVLLGCGLITIAIRVKNKNRLILSQVLFGGGIATFFITIYSAYQVYGLISSVFAFILMAFVSVFAFTIALAIDSAAMSIVGVIGGLMTPFIVKLDFIGLQGLGVYILTLALCSSAIYLYKKWQSLLLSSVIGIFLITGYLVSLGDLTTTESYQMGILIFLLLAIFNGTDYGLYYYSSSLKINKQITWMLLSILPLISLIQVYWVLDITYKQWSLLSLLMAFIYLLLTVTLYKKKGSSLITNITLSLMGFFALIATILYFEGNFRAMVIILMAMIFYISYEKSAHKFSRIVAHIIFFIGILFALVELSETLFNDSLEVIDVVTNILIILLATYGVHLQKDWMRQVFGVVIYEIFSVYFIITLIWHYTDQANVYAVLMLGFAVWMTVLLLLNRRLNFVPLESLMVMGGLPLLMKSLMSLEALINWEYSLFEFISTLIYSMVLYGIAHFLYKEEKKPLILSMKIMAYTLIIMTFLVDVLVLTDHFGYGLLLFGLMILLLSVVEKHLSEKVLDLTHQVMQYLWITIFILFMIFSLSELAFVTDRTFSVLPLLSNIGLLIVLYRLLKTLKLELQYRFIGQTIAYLIMVYVHFYYFENAKGTITLLWAAYAITCFTYYIVKANRTLVNLSLLLIVCIAGKFILIDLYTVDILWKIVTSMIFGVALLVLSYIIQPIIAKNERQLKQAESTFEPQK